MQACIDTEFKLVTVFACFYAIGPSIQLIVWPDSSDNQCFQPLFIHASTKFSCGLLFWQYCLRAALEVIRSSLSHSVMCRWPGWSNTVGSDSEGQQSFWRIWHYHWWRWTHISPNADKYQGTAYFHLHIMSASWKETAIPPVSSRTTDGFEFWNLSISNLVEHAVSVPLSAVTWGSYKSQSILNQIFLSCCFYLAVSQKTIGKSILPDMIKSGCCTYAATSLTTFKSFYGT